MGFQKRIKIIQRMGGQPMVIGLLCMAVVACLVGLWLLAGSAVVESVNTRVVSRQQNAISADYMKPVAGGRVFASLADARKAKPAPGDVILLRDMSEIAPKQAWASGQTQGKWQLRHYRLADGQTGKLLMANYIVSDDKDPAAIPPDFEVKLDLPGWYAIWVGVPKMDMRPRVGGLGGVDMALDGEPGYVLLAPEAGVRKQMWMGPTNVEMMCYWKCARFNGRVLRVRIPYGSFISQPWGFVRGSISSIKLVKMSDEQVKAYQRDISDPEVKRLICVLDGFSHYWYVGAPGKGPDARFVQTCRDNDYKMIFFQLVTTDVANYQSKFATVFGEGLTDEQWKPLRKGDRRAYDYIQWAIKNGQEGMKVYSELCRKANIEFHPSLRMNLALHPPFQGKFWQEHPELQKKSGWGLDYAKAEVRRFVISVLMELATKYDAAGINMDFTRWPPVADEENHDPSVLTSFIKEVRESLDVVGKAKGRRIKLSAMVVESYHAAGRRLEHQRIDLEAWLASGALDFICVEASVAHLEERIPVARKYNIPLYAIYDMPVYPYDPECAPDSHDPVAGEELQKEPYMCDDWDPLEQDRIARDRYRLGVAGLCPYNGVARHASRLGHVGEIEKRLLTGKYSGQEVGPAIEIE